MKTDKMVLSSKRRPIEAGSILTYSLKVDGPSNLKSLRVETLVADTVEAGTITPTTPLFPTTSFPVGAASLLPVGPPGHMLLRNGANITLIGSATPGATPLVFTWNALWNPSSPPLFGNTGSFIPMGTLLDQADYADITLGFMVTSNVITSVLATTRNVVIQISDRTTNTIVANCNFPIRLTSDKTQYLSWMGFLATLPPSFFEQDPAREWNIRFTAGALAAGETIDFDDPVVHVFLVGATLNA